jgi:hypothetical protein
MPQPPKPTTHQNWLQQFLATHGGVAGTVHLREGEILALVAAVRIPEPVLATVQRIDKGKGMAGLAFSRNQPVDTCNLQTDHTGDVRPGARAVAAQAAVALPVHDNQGEVRAVVGIAYAGEHTLTATELALLQRDAEALPLL